MLVVVRRVASELYKALCKLGDTVVYPILPAAAKPVWNHAAGPKTVFFWAPTIKWVIVFAGLADLTRPADKLSFDQYAAVTATGFVWTRYCFMIVPKNYYLASVNFFVGSTAFVQLLRIAHFHYSHPKPKWEIE
uniref:Mitochondrial pyruvate carrier n=1 Tax=Globodera rostochiensis TaxID=31243 RepID=A0A914I3S6_GLORO